MELWQHWQFDPQNWRNDAEDIEKAFWAPRIPEVCLKFLTHYGPKQPFWLAGGGSHTQSIQSFLEHAPFQGVIDQTAQPGQTFLGKPVVKPNDPQISGSVLLSHTCRERDLKQSLPSNCQPISIYEDARYLELCESYWSKIDVPASLDMLVIRAGRSWLLDDNIIARFAGKTQFVNLSRHDYPRGPNDLDLHQSLQWLHRIIEVNQPSKILLCSAWFNHFLALPLFHRYPQIEIWHECFDWNVLNPKGWNPADYGHSRSTQQWNLNAEWQTFQRSTKVLSKRMGPKFEAIFPEKSQASYLPYLPGLQEMRKDREPEEPWKIVYGGILPKPDQTGLQNVDYNFIDLFKELAKQGIRFDIFNSLDPKGDFEPYHSEFKNGPIQYHAQLPYPEYLTKIQGAHYGWIASQDRHESSPDQSCLIPKRAIGYLAAGIPIITDPHWQLLADLITQFQAGIVLDQFDPNTITNQLTKQSWQTHKSNVPKIHHHLNQINQKTLTHLTNF